MLGVRIRVTMTKEQAFLSFSVSTPGHVENILQTIEMPNATINDAANTLSG